MKSRLNVFVAALASILTATIQAQTTNPPYLSQFPLVERVKSEIKGSDPIDTSARQVGALWQLQVMVKTLAGPRFQTSGFTRDEDNLTRQYFLAWQRFGYKENGPPPQDKPRWYKLREFYENDPGFLDELLQRFFSPEFRAGYYRATGKQPATRPPAPPTAQPSAVLSVSNGLPAQGITQPLNTQQVFLLKDSFGSLLRKTGRFNGPPGAAGQATPVRAWGDACGAGSPLCQQVFYDMQGDIAAAASMDVKRGVTLPAVAPGTYHLFSFAFYNRQLQVWDLKVDVGPGANSITLDLGNVAQIDAPSAAHSSTAAARPSAQPSTSAGGSAKAYLAEGKKYFFAREFAKAVEPLKKAIALDPSLSEAHNWLSLSYGTLGRHQDALPPAKEALRLAPKDWSNHFVLGLSYFKIKQYGDALLYLKEAVRLKPDFAESHYWMGRVYADGYGQYDNAISALRKALRHNPDTDYFNRDLGAVYYLLKQYPQALDFTQRALRLTPNDATAHITLGRIFLRMGRKDDSIQVYNRLLTLDKQKAQELYAEINKAK